MSDVVSRLLGEMTLAGGIPALDVGVGFPANSLKLKQSRLSKLYSRRPDLKRRDTRLREDAGFPPLGMPAASVLYRRKRRALMKGCKPPDPIAESVLDLFATPITKTSIIPDGSKLIYGDPLDPDEEKPEQVDVDGDKNPTTNLDIAPQVQTNSVKFEAKSPEVKKPALPSGEMPRPDGSLMEATAQPAKEGAPKMELVNVSLGSNGLPSGAMPPPQVSKGTPGYLKFIR